MAAAAETALRLTSEACQGTGWHTVACMLAPPPRGWPLPLSSSPGGHKRTLQKPCSLLPGARPRPLSQWLVVGPRLVPGEPALGPGTSGISHGGWCAGGGPRGEAPLHSGTAGAAGRDRGQPAPGLSGHLGRWLFSPLRSSLHEQAEATPQEPAEPGPPPSGAGRMGLGGGGGHRDLQKPVEKQQVVAGLARTPPLPRC